MFGDLVLWKFDAIKKAWKVIEKFLDKAMADDWMKKARLNVMDRHNKYKLTNGMNGATVAVYEGQKEKTMSKIWEDIHQDFRRGLGLCEDAEPINEASGEDVGPNLLKNVKALQNLENEFRRLTYDVVADLTYADRNGQDQKGLKKIFYRLLDDISSYARKSKV